MTRGRIAIVCAAEAYGLVQREQTEFCALYPKATLEVESGTSREAVGRLFAAECDMAVIARELEPEERRAAVRGGLELQGYRFARDALVMMVNGSNQVVNMSVDDVRRIYRGEVTKWSDLGGQETPIAPVVQPFLSDVGEFFQHQVMGEEPIEAMVIYADSDSMVVARVKEDPRAIGFTSLAGAAAGVKVLNLASLTGLPYWKPDQEAVYRGDYPLTRYFNMYTRSPAPRLANGFITFVTSLDGQRIVSDWGLVPTAVPVRFVRRSPMQGAH